MTRKTPGKPVKKAAKTAAGKAAKTPAARTAKKAVKKTGGKTPAKKSAKPALLSGGNPQIAKGYGDEPVQAYIAAMPGWKSTAGRRIDTLIARAAPGVRKAVKWNSPMYGAPGREDWFLGVHVFAKYIKVAFFQGASLHPVPPVGSKHPHVRYVHIHEDGFDEAQFTDWVKQASRQPGEKM